MIISIVGNKRPAHDLSTLVDASELVVRISKMDWMDSGLVGQRTDVLYLEPNYVWQSYSAELRRLDMLRSIPTIYIRHSWWQRVGEDLISDGILRADQVQVIDPDVEAALPGCTTLAMAVYDMHFRFPDARLLVTGADVGIGRRRIFWGHVWGGEIEFLDGLITAGVITLA